MTAALVVQAVIPALLVLWLWLIPPDSHLGWAVQLVATLLLLALATRVSIWIFRPGAANAPMGGDPLPMLLAGRFLVRGDRFDLRGRTP